MKLLASFFVPDAPMGKQRPRFANGHAYTPAKTKDAEALIRQAAWISYRKMPYDGPVEFRLVVRIAKPKSRPKSQPWPTSRPDWDNYGKLVSDALNGVIWADDDQVIRAVVEKVYAGQGEQPGYEIAVYKIEEVA